MRFSQRTGWESGENPWALAVRARRSSGRELLDLTVASPTACGLAPDTPSLLQPLRDPRVLRYTPDPLGMLSAREAVCAYYGDKGISVAPERLCLTTSTSEGYSFLFRLLCDPGDEVLVATPSYPLFDLLAQLDDVVLRPYPLLYEPGEGGRWLMDLHALRGAVSERTRALIVVHPNNPTGNFASDEERAALRALCAEQGIALIADEVFLDYAIGSDEAAERPAERPGKSLAESFTAGQDECLCFALSGLSKVCALPGMKLSWIVVSGPAALVEQSLERLEIIADTFLSVSAPAQFALPEWLAGRGPVQAAIRARCRENLRVLDRRLAGSQASRLGLQGGWTAVLRVPRHVDGEAFALAAMERGVLVQPGIFYGLSAGYCVVSLLTPPEVWARGLDRLPV